MEEKSRRERQIKLCIVCDGGGHLREILLVSQDLPYDKYIVTFYSPHLDDSLKGYRYYTVPQYYRNIIKFIPNFWASLKIFMKERPDFVLTNGASVTVGTLLVAKIYRRKIIYITSAAQPFTASLTGRFAYPLSSLFLVCWEPLRKLYRKSVYVGDFFE
jgi:UDP-N-acetylglucosamine:LPS N-acetylglucosamine transferase